MNIDKDYNRIHNIVFFGVFMGARTIENVSTFMTDQEFGTFYATRTRKIRAKKFLKQALKEKDDKKNDAILYKVKINYCISIKKFEEISWLMNSYIMDWEKILKSNCKRIAIAELVCEFSKPMPDYKTYIGLVNKIYRAL